MRLICSLFAGFFLTFSAFAQDERYYRQILSGELPKQAQGPQDSSVHQFSVSGPGHLIDLDDDKIEESVHTAKVDGVDCLEVRASNKQVIFQAKLFSMGATSIIYKLKLVNISKDVKALIVFLDEGITGGRGFESTARIFVVSWENNDLKKMFMVQGPHIFHEKEAIRDQYHRRDYQVNVYDINNDGKREIAVQYNHIQRIMEYVGAGEWKRY